MILRPFWIALLIIAASIAQIPAEQHRIYPLPEERGAAGILQALGRLPVYGRVLYITAHPDDENAGTVAWLARSAHLRTAIFVLTRGDGGQNILGNEKYEAMGLLRTGEMIEACRLYGAEAYFSTAYEFGFSRSADETMNKWGREATLEEIVRFIRRFRPAVIFSAFRSDGSGGHGHHQTAGILSREAFRAAADPAKFPEHLKQGLLPWQAKSLYTGSMGGSGSGTLAIPSGDFDTVLGRSYRQIGAEGYSKHRSQGNGARTSGSTRGTDRFQIEDTVPGIDAGTEQKPFGGIDLTLPAILELAGEEKPKVEFLKIDLGNIQLEAQDAIRSYRPFQPWNGTAPILRGLGILKTDIAEVRKSSLSEPAKMRLVDALEEKKADFEKALLSLLGIELIARTESPTAVPGSEIPITVTLLNHGGLDIQLIEASLTSSGGIRHVLGEGSTSGTVKAGSSVMMRGRFPLPGNLPLTEPFWYRQKPEDSRYRTRPTPDPFAPFDPPAIEARATCRFRDADVTLTVPVTAVSADPLRGADELDLQIVPALSVSLKPGLAIHPMASSPQIRSFEVEILNNLDKIEGGVRLIAPAGWKVDPMESRFSAAGRGEKTTIRFDVTIPATPAPGSYQVDAIASAGGREYRQGYRVISYPENWTRNLYFPSHANVTVCDVKVAPGLTVGYIPGAGDEIPESLAQLGVKVGILGAAELAAGNLGHYGAIITGIRAYNVNADLRTYNDRLLKYVEQGGNLIVQYVRPLGRASVGGAAFPYGPYPMSNSDDARITVEESPVRILEPGHPVFNTPNKIGPADFDGWVQERGLYFMAQWDPKYTALLSGNDPGYPELKGGMLAARLGKGYYVYTAYAWFRQLPAGVPGAYRVFANLISLGK